MTVDPVESRRKALVLFQQLLVLHFNKDDLANLSFAVGIDVEELLTDRKGRLATDLIEESERRQRLPVLVAEVRRLRPGVDWPEIPPAPKPFLPELFPEYRLSRLLIGVSMGAVLVLLVFGWLYLNRIEPMGDGFNIAVAMFTTADKSPASQEAAEKLSDWLYTGLVNEVNGLPVWDKVEHRGPAVIGTVEGETQVERSQNAANLAEQHRATILIYGVITATSPGYKVGLEFYVDQRDYGYSSRGYSFGKEVAGPERLGKPVEFRLPLDATTLDRVNLSLNGRRKAMQFIVIGLGEYFFGNLEDAFDAFQDAILVEGWSPGEGQEVAYMFMGTTRLLAYDPLSAPDKLEEARTLYEKARRENASYARNYLGLGAVAFLSAQIINPETGRIVQVDSLRLRQAEGFYMTALDAADQDPRAFIALKAKLGLGSVGVLGYEFESASWSDSVAESYLNEVVTGFNDADQPVELVWIAADAHAQLALLAGVRQDWVVMAAESRQALSILEEQLPFEVPCNLHARYWFWIGLAEESQENYQAAHTGYQQALRWAENCRYITQAEQDEWIAGLARMEEKLP